MSNRTRGVQERGLDIPRLVHLEAARERVQMRVRVLERPEEIIALGMQRSEDRKEPTLARRRQPEPVDTAFENVLSFEQTCTLAVRDEPGDRTVRERQALAQLRDCPIPTFLVCRLDQQQ